MKKKRAKSVWEKIGPNEGVERILPQVPNTRKSKVLDAARPARPPGKRVSLSGKTYWETRENRSDVKNHPDPEKRML